MKELLIGLTGVTILLGSILYAVFVFQSKKIESLSAQLSTTEVKLAEYKIATDILQQQVDNINTEFETYVEEVERVGGEFDKYRVEVKELNNKISSVKFSNVANNKPVTLKRLINEGTDEVFKNE